MTCLRSRKPCAGGYPVAARDLAGTPVPLGDPMRLMPWDMWPAGMDTVLTEDEIETTVGWTEVIPLQRLMTLNGTVSGVSDVIFAGLRGQLLDGYSARLLRHTASLVRSAT